MSIFVYSQINPDGTSVDHNKIMELEELQKLVGGYIEVTPTMVKGRSMVVNEDGLSQGLPVNERAYKLQHPSHRWAETRIVGVALVVDTGTL